MWRVSGGEWVNNSEKKILEKGKKTDDRLNISDIHLLILQVARDDKTILLSKNQSLSFKFLCAEDFVHFINLQKFLFSVT